MISALVSRPEKTKMSNIQPVVDFNEYGLKVEDISKINDDTIKALGKEVIQAIKTYGYCYLKNHGVNESLVVKYFYVLRKFFEQPDKQKEKYSLGQDYAFGWRGLEEEKIDPKSQVGDLHEVFLYRPCSGYEAWPPVDNFETVTKEMFNVCTDLGNRFFDVLSLGLDQPKDFMRNAHRLIGQRGNSSALRTLYYPPIAGLDIKPGQARIGEHTDYGSVSLTFQDNVGGLEVRGPAANFIPADPIPGTVLVFIGGVLQRWTADFLTATSHRIPIPEDEFRWKSVRQSVGWFLHPDDEYVVTCLDGSGKYEPITSRGYINYKLQEAMPYLDPTLTSPADK